MSHHNEVADHGSYAALLCIHNTGMDMSSDEEEEQKVSVRSRYLGDEGSKDLGEFIEAIKDEIAKKTIRKIEVEE
jgi:hypothetical protein